MRGVRFREGEGFEGQCEGCLDWWPIDGDFWDAHRSLRRCRACVRDGWRMSKAKQREDPERLALERAADRLKRDPAKERERHALRQRVRYHQDPAFRVRRLSQTAAYYQANRDRLREKNRERYLARKAA